MKKDKYYISPPKIPGQVYKTLPALQTNFIVISLFGIFILTTNTGLETKAFLFVFFAGAYLFISRKHPHPKKVYVDRTTVKAEFEDVEPIFENLEN